MRILLFLFICFALNSYAQDAPIKWGKISEEELSMTSYEHDADADAVVLCDYGIIKLVDTGNGYGYQFNRMRRVKILKESGLGRGDVFISYRHHNANQQLRNIGAQVFLPDGEKRKIGKKDIFNEVKNKYWSSKNFSIPNLQVGSVFEYHYEISSDHISSLIDWYFQDDIPTIHSELKIIIPKYFEYIFLLNGYELTNASKNVDASEYGSSLKIVSATNPFILKNIPAMEEENFITSMDDYRLGVRFQLNTIHYPNGIVEPYLSTWEEVAKEIEEHRYIGQQYSNPKNYKKLLAQSQTLFENAKDENEKVKIACEFLQKEMVWSGYYSYSSRHSLDKIFEEKKVHSGEMNLLLMALLQANDIAVYPLLLSTRGHGRMITSYPIIDQFNHLMVYAVVDGQELILDLGNDLRPPQIPRTNALNNMAWLVNGIHSKWIDIKAPASRQTVMATMMMNEDGILEGSFKGKYSGYDALTERSEFQEDQEGQYWQERLTDNFPEAEISNFQVKNEENPEVDFVDQFDCIIPDAIQESGDLLYLQPVLYSDSYENPLKQSQRFYPIDIPFPSKEQYIFSFTIPEGFEIESLPEPLNIRLFEKSASFNYDAKVTGQQLVVRSKLQLTRLRYSPLEYGNMKEFFDQLVEKMKEPVVLKKVK